MKNRLSSRITVLTFLCLLLAGAAQADVVKKCYIDGNDVAEQTGPRALSYNYHRLIIAAEGNFEGPYNGIRGAIDEFAIYDRVLDEPNIGEHANSLPGEYVAIVTADAPVLWLRFEDPCSANGYTAADSSGNGQDGTYIGDGNEGPFGDVNLVTGWLGTAAEFYGTAGGNGTCIDVNDANGALELQDLTIEFWFKSWDLYGDPENPYYSKFFSHNGGADTNSYATQALSGPVVTLIGGGDADYDPYDPNLDVNDGDWHHVVFTFNSSPDPNPDPNISPYPEEILEDAPVLYIRCEQEPLVDSSGHEYWVDYDNLTIQKVKGSMGNCALLNGGWIAGANQGSEPSSDPCYGNEYAFGDDLTVEMWLYYPDDVDSWDGLWNQNAKTDVTEWSPACQTGRDRCRMACNENRAGEAGYAYTNAGAWASDGNNWHHYVMVYDVCDSPAQITVQWYTDNVNYKDSTYGTDVFDNYIGPVMDHILFGASGSRIAPTGGYGPLAGTGAYMDEIAVYDYALSSDRIDAHWRAWQPRDCNEIWYRELGDEWEDIDKNKDCDIDFYDYAMVAQEWALCNNPLAAGGCP